ncbi:MAG: threonine--tRNA ligase [Thermoprotei archaeon]|nr:MAG: threonine--tRNA ligase [Thermoprotei archaeon]
MRILLIHAEKFSYEVKQRALAKAEEVKEKNRKYSGRNVLVAFTTVEEKDYDNLPSIVEATAKEIADVAEKVKASEVVIYPYAHLSRNLATPSEAMSVLRKLYSKMIDMGVKTYKAPFGWYKAFEIKCYGHPLSELSREVKIEELKEEAIEEKHEYAILTPEGKIVAPEEYEFKDGNFKVLVEKEVFKKELPGGVPLIPSYCAKFSIEWEPYSDHGHMRYGPEGALIIDLLSEYSWNIARDLGIPVFYVKGTNMFNLDVNAVREHAELFGSRLYSLKVEGNKLILRFAACHQQFAMLKDWIISYKNLPFGVFEVADSYRLERPGELTLCFRLRKFYMPDLHIINKDLEEAKKMTLIVQEKILNEIKKIGREYYAIYNITKSFLKEHWNYVLNLVRREGKPVLLVFYPEGKYYWVINVEYNIIDHLRRPREIGTFQIDVGNAKRFGIKYVSEKGEEKYPVIIHTAIIGSLERYLYAILDTAAIAEKHGDKPRLPTWLAPTQVRIIPISKELLDYSIKIAKKLEEAKIRVDVDDRDETLGKKIRDAEKSWIPYIAVIGKKELENNVLSVRIRGKKNIVILKVDELIKIIKDETTGYPWKPLPMPMLLSKRPIYRKE